MTITITALKLRSLWGFFPLSYNAMHILKQMRTAEGFRDFKKYGVGYTHYTCSAWESHQHARMFSGSGAHLEAMKKASRFACEIRIFTYEGNSMPDWTTARRLLSEKGRLMMLSR